MQSEDSTEQTRDIVELEKQIIYRSDFLIRLYDYIEN